MAAKAELRKRLRALGRALRPFEKEAEAILNEVDERDILGELEDLYSIAEELSADVRRARENIAEYLRPRRNGGHRRNPGPFPF